jgi:methylmalonyl-CoA mutase cobalamin-binding subunit
MEQVMMPLMHLIGERWHTGSMRTAEEHMTTPIVRATLWSLKNSQRAEENAPELLVATPAGQKHELGAVMAAVVAASDGWRVTYLGSDMPATEIAAAAVTREVRAIALSLTYPSDDPAIGSELTILTGTVPAVVLVGGVVAAAYRDGIRRAGAMEVPTTAVLRAELRKLRIGAGRPGDEAIHG